MAGSRPKEACIPGPCPLPPPRLPVSVLLVLRKLLDVRAVLHDDLCMCTVLRLSIILVHEAGELVDKPSSLTSSI